MCSLNCVHRLRGKVICHKVKTNVKVKLKAVSTASHHSGGSQHEDQDKINEAGETTKKSVQFAANQDSLMTVNILESCNANASDIDSCSSDTSSHRYYSAWLSSEDYSRITAERNETVVAFCKVHGKAEHLDPDRYCLRGIESLTFPQIRHQQKLAVYEVIHAVLDHQKLYTKMGMSQDKVASALNSLSRISSESSREKALALAAVDEAAVNSEAQEDSRDEESEERAPSVVNCE